MMIMISECLNSDSPLLKALANYTTIDKMLIYADLPYWDIAVKFNTKWHIFRHCCEDYPERSKWMKELAKLPAKKRRIPNDTMIIKCDEFERELYINLDGE